jgi:hypothetical protein
MSYLRIGISDTASFTIPLYATLIDISGKHLHNLMTVNEHIQ